MNDMTDYYDKLDLKYPEIAIAMDDIDRICPGEIRFIIPVLTPNMSTEKIEESTVYQNSSNLQNKNTKPEVTNLTQQNYVKIRVPKELCAYVGGVFELLETYEWPENAPCEDSILYVRDAYISISNAHQIGSGTVVEGGSINVTGSVTGDPMLFNEGIPRGFLNLMPVDRYIKAPSKWIVVFLGGDITQPKIIARYPEEPEEEE